MFSDLKKRHIRHFLNYPASEISGYKTGGEFQCLAWPKNAEEVKFLLDFSRRGGLPFLVLGALTNVLVSDKGVRGVTVSTLEMNDITAEGNVLRARAGAPLDAVAALAVEKGLAGMEKMSGIPGSVGGAVFMNAGAFGRETFDNLILLEAMDFEGKEFSLGKSEIRHSYRKTEELENIVILSARFGLRRGDKKKLTETRKKILAERRETQPLEYPSAGSVFKRPPGGYASKIIDECGLKGLTAGGAQVSRKHAGFIINRGGATSSDIYNLISKVRREVKSRAGIELELEQKLLGNFGEAK